MMFESDFHQAIENTLTKVAWKLLGDEIGLHRRKQLMREPFRATTAELLVFERLTQTPAKVLIELHGLGASVLTESELAMHTQRNQHNLILPPYGDSKNTTLTGAARAVATVPNRNRRPAATATVPTT